MIRTPRTVPTAPAGAGVDKTEQKQRQGFRPGVSGNPKGRPQGSRHKATLAALALMAGDLETITEKLVEKAKAGDMVAIRLIMDKLIGPAKDQPISFKLPKAENATDLRVALATILKAVSTGKLTPEEGKAVAEIVNSLGLALAVEDLEAQLEELQGRES